MRAWPLHVVFATILVGSLAAKARAPDVLDIDNVALQTAVARVARSQGLDFQANATIPGTNVPALAFEAPSCSRPIFVLPRAIFDDEPLVRAAGERGYVLRFIYLDRSWKKPDRLALFVERMKYVTLATLDLTRYVPSGHLLLVASPSQCPAADAIDWREVWNRDYLGAASAPPEATTR